MGITGDRGCLVLKTDKVPNHDSQVVKIYAVKFAQSFPAADPGALFALLSKYFKRGIERSRDVPDICVFLFFDVLGT